MTPVEIRARLDELAGRAAACTACRLHEGRTQAVFADGSPEADIMFIGEGPGYNEDKEGLPFVGKAGMLLNRLLREVGLDRARGVHRQRGEVPPSEQPGSPPGRDRGLQALPGRTAPAGEPRRGHDDGATSRPSFCSRRRWGSPAPGARSTRGGGGVVIPTFHPAAGTAERSHHGGDHQGRPRAGGTNRPGSGWRTRIRRPASRARPTPTNQLGLFG